MSNLLPPEARTAMFRSVSARFMLTGGLVFSCVALVALLALLPALLMTMLPRMTLSDSLPTVSPEQLVQEEEDRAIASRMRVLLATLTPFVKEKVPVHTLITRIIELRPQGITIETIQYKSATQGEISIVGSALSREQVNAYREALVAEGKFTGVSVPVSALVAAAEGNFRMTLTGAF